MGKESSFPFVLVEADRGLSMLESVLLFCFLRMCLLKLRIEMDISMRWTQSPLLLEDVFLTVFDRIEI